VPVCRGVVPWGVPRPRMTSSLEGK
jgi:hypothetical protein